MNPTWNLLAMMCWDITYGLDMQNPNPAMWSEEDGLAKCPPPPHGGPGKCMNWTKTLWRPFQHYHTHAGAKIATEAPGAWLQLRDALDYSDATRFPVSEFGGPVARNNTARLKSIVAAHSAMGAVLEDPVSAAAGRHKSRGRRGINSAGWRIWPHNYGKWMEQVDPTGTSVGRWCVGDRSNLLGQSTRQTIPGKNMSFTLSPGLFVKQQAAAAGPMSVFVRVAYFDEGHGGWDLYYASSNAAGGLALAGHVNKTNTKQFVEVRVKLTDLSLRNGTEVHFSLVDSDATMMTNAGTPHWDSSDPDVFAWIEVLSTEFVYQMAEVVRDL